MAITMHIIAIWRPPVFLGFNYDAQMHRPIQIQHFRNLRIRDPDILSRANILAFGGHLLVFWPYFHCLCSAVTFELLVKILTSIVDW